MSKANQAFKHNDEAVSPVIGVILMVAITVVLAAVVFVLVSNLGEGSESAPSVAFNKDSSAYTLTIARADAGLTWDQFNVTVTENADNSDLSADCTFPYDSDADAPVAAGNVINCGGASGVDEADRPFTVRVTHTPTNTLVYTTTFN